MRTSLLISLLIHFGILLLLEKFPSLTFHQPPYRFYRAELILGKSDLLKEEDIEDRQNKDHGPDTVFSPETGEFTISLNTKDKMFRDYARLIKEIIQKNWQYPEPAKKQGLEGHTTLFFTINRDGKLIKIRIKKGSGHAMLDMEAKRAVMASAPFPEFPPQIIYARLNIIAGFEYKLKKE